MLAGEIIKIEMEFNFTTDAHAKDWSLTAYGDGRKGTLHLNHDKNLKSDTFGHIQRKDPGTPLPIPHNHGPAVVKDPEQPKPVAPVTPTPNVPAVPMAPDSE